MSSNFDKFAILESFLDEVNSYLPEIQANLDRLQQRPDDIDTIEETYRRTHTIAGSAAMMEFAGLARVAQGMEDILGDALDNQSPVDAPTVALLRRSFARLSRLADNIRTGADDGSAVAEDDADRAAWRGGGAGTGGASSAPGSERFAASSSDGHGALQGNGYVAQNAPIQVPDWLAAFAAPTAGEGGNAAAASSPATPTPPVPGQPFDQPYAGGPAFEHGAPSLNAWSSVPHAPSGGSVGSAYSGSGAMSDPYQQSVSGLPTGYTPAAPSHPHTNGALPNDPFASSFNGSPDPFGLSDVSAGMSSVSPEATFDDILRSFQASAAQAYEAAASPDAPPAHDVADFGTSALPTMPPASRPQAGEASRDQYAFYGASTPMTPSSYAPQALDQRYAPSAPAMSAPAASAAQAAMFTDVRAEEEAVRRQVASLRDVAAELREAAQAMEDERSELRSFLDGSRDALERLEDWAGQQMGLDLRHSPDAVRRYLPLSVIWVTTTRLKQLVTLLKNSGRGLTVTQEQIEETLGGLRSAMDSAGAIYSSMTAVGGAPASGFSATVAQVTWTPPAPPQPPAVDAIATSSLRPRPDEALLSPGARAELERDVREQLRRELEDDVRTEIAVEVRREEEDRLRQEIQIQVRRQLLAELTPGMSTATPAVGSAFSGGEVLPQMLLSADRAPKPVQVTSDQSPEALEVFREEAQEHLQTITAGIAQLESTPSDTHMLQTVRRAMHTLKGAAGMMGFTTIQQIAHASEDLLDGFVEDGISLTPEILSLLLDTSEGLDQLISGLVSDPDDQHQLLRTLTQRYAAVTGIAVEAPPADHAPDFERSDAAVATSVEAEQGPEAPAAGATTPDLSVRLQLSKLDDLVNLFGELLINRSILEERIDRLNHIVGDTVVVSERLREVGSQLETRFEAATLPSGRGTSPMLGAPSRANGNGWASSNPGMVISGGLQTGVPAHAHEFDELELDRYTEFHRLSRGLSEGVADVVTLSHEMETIIRESQASFAREARLTSDFQDRLLKARLVPLQSLVPRLYRTARASALREGKEIEFFAEGMSTEVDRKVFEEVAGPLLHLVRNSVNHGIERPNVREMAGKPRAGKILVSAAYEGNQVVISVRDDGAGVDPEKIRETAVARGWIDPYTHLTEKEAINLIFRSGVSTAAALTEESGRGVGLDVVRDSVTGLRGTVEVESSVNQGTLFTMKFPISLQIARAVLVRVGSQTLAIPMAVVDQIGRLDYYQRIPSQPPAIELRGERYPLAQLASYLKVQPGTVDERASVLLVNAGKRRVALLVDAIVAQQEVVSKPLGPHLREVRGVAGAAVLGNGQVVLILEMHELLAQQPRDVVQLPQPGTKAPAAPVTQLPTSPMPAVGAATQVRTVPLPGPAAPVSQPRREFVVARPPAAGASQSRVVVPPAAQSSYVLVVDDSPSVRRVVSNMLKAHGWEVQTARDGVEALEVIARQVPAAVLLDIEMPRMDGYELMATVRSQEQYRFLPLIVLTSRAATKHQQRALQLGADAYVVKPYQDEELLNTIASLVQARR